MAGLQGGRGQAVEGEDGVVADVWPEKGDILTTGAEEECGAAEGG